MRKPTLFACLLLLSLGASANTRAKNPGCPDLRTCGDPNSPHPLPPPPGTPIIRDFRLLANGETPRIPHKAVTIMPGDPPVIERLKPETQIHEAEAELSQNAPPTIRDSQTPMPKLPAPPIVRGSLTQPQTSSELAQNEPPTVRDSRIAMPKPPDPPVVRGSLIQPQTNSELAQLGGFGTVGFVPPDTPIVRGSRIPKQPAPKPPASPIVRGLLTPSQTNSELAQSLVPGGFGTVAFEQPDTPVVRDSSKQPTSKPLVTRAAPAAGSKPADPHPTPRPAPTPIIRDFRRQAV